MDRRMEAEEIKDKVQTCEALERKHLIDLLCKHDFTFAARDPLKATFNWQSEATEFSCCIIHF